MRKFLLLCFLVISSAWATVFNPVPLEDLLKESEVIIHGKFIDESYKKLPTGEIVTESNFRIQGQAGLESKYLHNQTAFKVISPGGKWQGLVYKVEGVPHFDQDEEVILMLSKNKFGHSLTNLALSKFKVIRKNRSVILKNEIFPENPRISGMTLERFDELVSYKYSRSLSDKISDKIVRINKIDKERMPSSIADDLESENQSAGIYFWLILFALMGGAARVFMSYLQKHK